MTNAVIIRPLLDTPWLPFTPNPGFTTPGDSFSVSGTTVIEGRYRVVGKKCEFSLVSSGQLNFGGDAGGSFVIDAPLPLGAAAVSPNFLCAKIFPNPAPLPSSQTYMSAVVYTDSKFYLKALGNSGAQTMKPANFTSGQTFKYEFSGSYEIDA